MSQSLASALVVLLTVSSLKIMPTSSYQTPLRCGEVLTNGNGGTILYKAFELVSPNERCVWIIAIPGALGYTIDILHLHSPTNQPESLQKLVITGISYNEGYWDVPTSQETMYPPLQTSLTPTETGPITFNNSNLVMITFATEVGEGNGFAIQYEEILTGDGQIISLNTTHHILEDPTLDFLSIYPPHGGNYDKYELAALVFIPRNNIFSNDQPLISYKGLGSNHKGCSDAVYVYNFNFKTSNTNSLWKLAARGCVGVSRLEITKTDISLILVKTNENDAVFPGLRFHYVGCNTN